MKRSSVVVHLGWSALAVAAILLLASATGIVALVGTVPEPEPAPETHKREVEGVVKSGPLFHSPVGEPFLYAHFRVTFVAPSSTGTESQEYRLWTGTEGDRHVRVRDSKTGKSRGFVFPTTDEGYRNGFVTKSVRALDNLPVVGKIPGHENVVAESFNITMVAVRPGDHVLLTEKRQRQVTEVWFGGRQGLTAGDSEPRAAIPMSFVAGSGIGGLSLSLLGLFLIRRR